MAAVFDQIIKNVYLNRQTVIRTTFHGSSGYVTEDLSREIISVFPSSGKQGRYYVKAGSAIEGDILTVMEPVFPPERLIILGGGHIALSVCSIGAKCGFSVCVVDDRPEFANEQRFPEAHTVICGNFEKTIRNLSISPFDYIVIVTRGHKSDAVCLREILPGSEPAYLGMIGSKRRVRGLLEMLAAEGFEQEKLNQICTPIGLEIGAVTTEEIAVSIMAEVISYRRLPEFRKKDVFYCESDLEISVLEYLAKYDGPIAIVTIIETKGSTPRAAGAKMAVDKLGNTFGSIGGGCAENSAIQEACTIIGTGRYEIVDIDLTGDIAEYDGMVCGGTMKILIEDVPVE